MTDLSPVDVSGLLALRELQPPGKPDAVARIVNRFFEESEQRIQALHQAVESDDALALERSAHALKGISGTVGANEMLELAVRLEQIGRQGRIQGGLELVKELELALSRARPIYDRWGLC